SVASAAASSARRATCTSSPYSNPHTVSHRSIGFGYSVGRPAKTVITVTPGCAAMRYEQPSTESSRWGETITMRSSSPGAARPQSRMAVGDGSGSAMAGSIARDPDPEIYFDELNNPSQDNWSPERTPLALPPIGRRPLPLAHRLTEPESRVPTATRPSSRSG